MNKMLFLFIVTLFFSVAYGKNNQPLADQSITLFTGPNAYSKVITKLPADSNVEVLGTDMGTGFAYIRTQSKQKGWIKMQHLQKMPAKDGLVPITPAKATPQSSIHFTSWLKQKWHHAKNTVIAKKKVIMANFGWIINTTVIFIIGLLVGILLMNQPSNKLNEEFVWRR